MRETRERGSVRRKLNLRRVTRSLLYRHLLRWGSTTSDRIEPPPNVMVFDGREESTDPPLHFLRLRVLQFLARRRRGQDTVNNIRHEFTTKLGLEPKRVNDTLHELAVKRSRDDNGMIRIDGLPDAGGGEQLRGEMMVHLLPAGRYLLDELYVTVEYLFWSAINNPSARELLKLPRDVTSDHIQSDPFRVVVAARFLQRYIVECFRDEHPFLRGVHPDWSERRVRAHLACYHHMFGFSRENWYLTHATDSLANFIPPKDRDPLFAEAREEIAKARELVAALDRLAAVPAAA